MMIAAAVAAAVMLGLVPFFAPASIELARYPGIVGVLLLATAFATRRPVLVPCAIGVLALGLAIGEVDVGPAYVRWSLYGALLLLVGELAFGALETREVGFEDPSVRRARLALALALPVVAFAASTAVLVLAGSAPTGAGLALTGLGVVAVLVLFRLFVSLAPDAEQAILGERAPGSR